ncbi:hypothetical protein V1514DRAFT_156507 [Lipomyces japonicus]|uniref:uncharacterized protein n=1 Tax=Lipomyces japonicus TaxID=56871 RepID=UPI0034CF45C5
MSKTCLVTTGATYPFTELIDAALSPLVMARLCELGFATVRVQYGSHVQGKRAFDRAVAALVAASGQNVKVTGFSLTEDMLGEIASASLVISHAGTGTILDVLRQHRPLNKNYKNDNVPVPLVVVANDKLMHGHQDEIAAALATDLHVVYARELAGLAVAVVEAVTAAKQGRLVRLPSRHSLRAVIDVEAGLVTN